MNEFIFTAATKDVILARLIRFLHAWPADKACSVKVTRFVKTRSVKQNAALWGLAYKILAEETGNDPEDLHDYFCRRFFGVHEYEVLGETRSRPLRTTTTNEDGKHDVLPWDRFAEFFDFIQRFAATELQIYIPDPDPDWWQKARAA